MAKSREEKKPSQQNKAQNINRQENAQKNGMNIENNKAQKEDIRYREP